MLSVKLKPFIVAALVTAAVGVGALVVPKKYVEKVGEAGFKKHPIGAGPFKFVSFTPGIELVLEADGWRIEPPVSDPMLP